MAAFIDNFNRPDSATVGNGWIEETAGEFSISGNTLLAESLNSPGFGDKELLRPAGENFADGMIKNRFKHVTSIAGVPQLHGRVVGATMYLCFLTSTQIHLARYNGSTITYLQTSITTPTRWTNRQYELQLECVGSNISCRLIDLQDGVLQVEMKAQDSTYSAAGQWGISAGGGATQIAYDDVAIIPEADKLIHYWDFYDEFYQNVGYMTTTAGVSIVGYKNSWQLRFISGAQSATDVFVEPSVPYIIQLDLEVPNTDKIEIQATDAVGTVRFNMGIDGAAADPRGYFDTDTLGIPDTFNWTPGEPKLIQLLVDPVGNTVRGVYTSGIGISTDSQPFVGPARSYSGGAVTNWKVNKISGAGNSYVDSLIIYTPKMAWEGDSITDGHAGLPGAEAEYATFPSNGSRGNTSSNKSHYLNYQYMLLQNVPEWGPNQALDGSETSHVNTRLNAGLTELGPESVTVWVSSNDIINSVPEATIKANLTSIIDKLQAAGIASGNITVVECAPRNNFDAAMNLVKASVNLWLFGEAQTQRVKIAQVHNILEGTADKLHVNYAATDGVHLNTAGLKLVAQTVLAATVPPSSGALFARHLRQLQTA